MAAGKGVSICHSIEEASKKSKEILEGKFKSSKKLILEEFLEGEELSYFSIVDENSYYFFGSAQDHKRVGEGDTGKNTGGMGCYSPSRLLNDHLEQIIKTKKLFLHVCQQNPKKKSVTQNIVQKYIICSQPLYHKSI